MAKAKDFLNGLIAVRDRRETVVIGWHTLSFEENHGRPWCRIELRRPTRERFCDPSHSVGISGFAFPSNSISAKARILARADAEYDRLRSQHEAAKLQEEAELRSMDRASPTPAELAGAR